MDKLLKNQELIFDVWNFSNEELFSIDLSRSSNTCEKSMFIEVENLISKYNKLALKQYIKDISCPN